MGLAEHPPFDVGVVVSFGYMIPAEVLAQLPFGAVNLHPSLLPMYRGAAPVQRCLLNGEAETGISIIRVTAHEFDSGEVLKQRRYPLLRAAHARADAVVGVGVGGQTRQEGEAVAEQPLGDLVASELLAVLAARGADDVLDVLRDLDGSLQRARYD